MGIIMAHSSETTFFLSVLCVCVYLVSLYYFTHKIQWDPIESISIIDDHFGRIYKTALHQTTHANELNCDIVWNIYISCMLM